MPTYRLPRKAPRDQRKAEFVDAFKTAGTIRGAAKATGVAARTHYDWVKQDEAYAREFDFAQKEFGEKVEDVMFDRIFNDPKCHHVLIIFALKGLMREKYGDRVIPFDEAAADTLDKLLNLSDKPKVRAAGKVVLKEIRADDPLGVEA